MKRILNKFMILTAISVLALSFACSDSGGSSSMPLFDSIDKNNSPVMTEFYFSSEDNPSLDSDYYGVRGDTGIDVILPASADLGSLAPRFTFNGTSVQVNDEDQTSGSSAHDFSTTITYTVIGDSDNKNYSVTVTVDAAPVITMTAGTTLTEDTVIAIDASDDHGLADGSVLINGISHVTPVEFFIDVDRYAPGELVINVEATDNFGQTVTAEETFIIERQTILDNTVTIGTALFIDSPALNPGSWAGTGAMTAAEGSAGSSILTATGPSSLINSDITLADMIVEADVKLISGSGYSIVLRAADNSNNYSDGYAFVFDPGLIDPDSGLRLSYYPLDIDIAATIGYAGIEGLSGWHRVSFAILTDPDDGLTYLEAYIGIYENPEDGTGLLDYDLVYSQQISGLHSHNRKPWNRISSLDLINNVQFNSDWDENLNTLYDAGSFAFTLPQDGSQLEVKHITVQKISH